MGTFRADYLRSSNGNSAPVFDQALPGCSATRSVAWAYTPTGYGSTDTFITAFSGNTSSGSDISVTNTAANGTTFTINTTGVYACAFYGSALTPGGGRWMGITRNSASLATSIAGVAVGIQIGKIVLTTASHPRHVSNVLPLSSGDVLRPHTDQFTEGSTASSFMIVTRIF